MESRRQQVKAGDESGRPSEVSDGEDTHGWVVVICVAVLGFSDALRARSQRTTKRDSLWRELELANVLACIRTAGGLVAAMRERVKDMMTRFKPW